MKRRLLTVLLWALPAAAAVEFTGAASEQLECGATNLLDDLCTGGAPCTISAWIYPDSIGVDDAITFDGSFFEGSLLAFTTDATGHLKFRVQYSTTELERVGANGSLSTGEWQHVLVHGDGSQTAANVHIYVNGSEVSYQTTTDGSGTRNSTAGDQFHIGNNSGGGGTFDGQICCVSVYDYELSASDIALLSGAMQMNLGLGLDPVGYWTLFDHPDGQQLGANDEPGAAFDMSGNGYHCSGTANPVARAMPFGLQ